MSASPQPFRLHVDDAAIAELRDRPGRTRVPGQAPGEAWDAAFPREIVEFFRPLRPA